MHDPDERIAAIVEDAGATVALVQSHVRDRMRAPSTNVIELNERAVADVVSTIAVILAAGVLLLTLLIKQPPMSVMLPQVEQVRGLRIDAANITSTTGNARIAQTRR